MLDAELRQLFLLFHGEGLQHLHRGTTILMQLLPASVLLLQQVDLMAELCLVLLKSQDFAGRLFSEAMLFFSSITKPAVNFPC